VAVLLAALGAFWSFAGPGAPTAQARTADELLVDRPLAPTDVNILKTDVYPSGAPLVPAAGNEPSEQQAKAGLDAYLTAEFPGSAASQNAAKAVFDDATAKAKIPSHSLRAALAALTGTVAELPRRHNINAMERLNGGMGSRLGLYATNGNRPIFPGSPTVTATSIWGDVDNGDTVTTPRRPPARLLPRQYPRARRPSLLPGDVQQGAV